MDRINEFNNSAFAKSIANQQREKSDSKITTIATGVVLVLLMVAFKYAIGN